MVLDRVALLRGINVGGHRKLPMADPSEAYRAYPFGPVTDVTEQTRHFVCFCRSTDDLRPSSEGLARLVHEDWSPERIAPGEGVVYFHSPGGYAKSRFTDDFLERLLGIPTTTRNVRTVERLLEMIR